MADDSFTIRADEFPVLLLSICSTLCCTNIGILEPWNETDKGTKTDTDETSFAASSPIAWKFSAGFFSWFGYHYLFSHTATILPAPTAPFGLVCTVHRQPHISLDGTDRLLATHHTGSSLCERVLPSLGHVGIAYRDPGPAKVDPEHSCFPQSYMASRHVFSSGSHWYFGGLPTAYWV